MANARLFGGLAEVIEWLQGSIVGAHLTSIIIFTSYREDPTFSASSKGCSCVSFRQFNEPLSLSDGTRYQFIGVV
ncbi:MAG: hypothetical protein QG621_184 [Patescibacteria group bacterium]|nr:hypothetical protein [Patescibacteria group bacterium]